MDQYFHDQRFDSSSGAQLWLLASALPQVFPLKVGLPPKLPYLMRYQFHRSRTLLRSDQSAHR